MRLATGGRMRRLALGAALLSLLAAPSRAGRWYEDYADAVKAIEQGECDRALELLQPLVRDQPEPARKKRTYGFGNYVDYLPHYRLGQAHWCLGQRDRALAALEEAERHGVVLQTDESDRFRELLGKVRAARATPPPRLATPGNTPVATPGPSVPEVKPGAKRTPPPPAPGRRFETLVQEAESALRDRHCDLARERLEQARIEAGEEFGRRGLDRLRGQALACIEKADGLVAEARAQIGQGRLGAAARSLAGAAETQAMRADVKELLATIEAREKAYAASKRESDRQLKLGNPAAALEQLRAAGESHAERFAEEGGAVRLREIEAALAKQGVPAPALPARTPEPAPTVVIAAPGVAPGLPAATPQPAAPGAAQELRPALRALFEGRVAEAVRDLERLAEGAGRYSAEVHAYLGVAYATLGFGSLGAEGERYHELAREEFRRARAARPGYALSDRVVSPRIRELFAQAARN